MSSRIPRLAIKLKHNETISEVSSSVFVAVDRLGIPATDIPAIGNKVWLQINGGTQYYNPSAPSAPPLRSDHEMQMTPELYTAFTQENGQDVDKTVYDHIQAMLPSGFTLDSVKTRSM
jgi:hypothetical protein